MDQANATLAHDGIFGSQVVSIQGWILVVKDIVSVSRIMGLDDRNLLCQGPAVKSELLSANNHDILSTYYINIIGK